ncbi:MAG: N-acetyl-gamma-glutamyl-phosphate reductase [Rhodospirillales bacterium]|jgi:N-acetyl-gamma-glutamyl-phosphate reductase|nr:N-acetyl-gamma-glutamyl-phosphate reductase [Rhodospirillales bacterium]
MTAKVFIDGEAGTTGLQIARRLSARRDVELLRLGSSERKDASRRAAMLNGADLSILCLPEDAARQAVALIEDTAARVIDASTAHRMAPGWTYGFPEFEAGRGAEIAVSKRVANPGCYALGAVAMLHPLVAAGLVPADFAATVNAVSGYSGGGKKLIAAFEDAGAPDRTDSNYYLYGLGLEHKHTEEIRVHGGLTHRPLFVPSVGRFAQGMIVSLPLQLWALPEAPKAEHIHAALADHYAGRWAVSVSPLAETDALADRLDAEAARGTDRLTLHVFANDAHSQAVACAVLDNLGKGASGQAVQNMNLMLGLPETTGLEPEARDP